MDWLRIDVATLESMEFLVAGPEAAQAWMLLLAHCAVQENGGRIVGCAEWDDRTWQRVARVSRADVMCQCGLWEWDGDDLVVLAYPVHQVSVHAGGR